MLAMLIVRRARRDAVLLLVIAVLVAFAVSLATVLPRLVGESIDEGARSAVAAAGSDADVVARTTVGTRNSTPPAASVDRVLELAADLPHQFSGALAGVVGEAQVSVSSPDAGGVVEDSAARPTRVAVRFGMLGDPQRNAIEVVAGRLPRAGADDLEIVISPQAADAASVGVGSAIVFPIPDSTLSLRAVVVGIVSTPEEAARPWLDLPRMWAPAADSRGVAGSGVGIMGLAAPEAITQVQPLVLTPLDARVRVSLVSSAFTAEREARVAAELRGLDLHSAEIVGDFPASVGLSSGFTDALADFPVRARAAVAQSSLQIAGLLGVAAVVLAQLGRLLVLRRSGDLTLERARGVSLPRVALAAMAESAVIVTLGGGLGALISGGVAPASVLVALVAVLAPPVQAVIVARSAWWSRRVAANGVDRRAVERAVAARRVALEVVVLLLAAGAIVAIRGRGLLQGATAGIDPLLAAAPLLLAAAVAIVLLRVYPLVVRAAAAVGRRSVGALGLLGSVQAQRALTPLPVLALTLAAALAIGGGLLIETVAAGQRDASWSSVGADARVTAPVTDDVTASLAKQPGVTAAGSFLAMPTTGLTGGPATAFVTLIAVGPGYGDVVEGLRGTPAAGASGDATRLRSLATASAGERLPVLVDPVLAARLADVDELVVTVGGINVRVVVAGTVSSGPGLLSTPLVYIDRHALAERLGTPIVADTTLLLGPGAAAAATSVQGGTVVTRTGWIVDQQGEALVAGVNRAMLLSTASVALLAVISLIAGVLAGSRARARSLALLRTLGMRSRLGWWLAVAETVPVVIAALVGGILAGVGIVLLLGPSLGLAALAGGVATPQPSLSPGIVLAVAGAALGLLAIAVAVEVASQRRDRLSEVLRVGETI